MIILDTTVLAYAVGSDHPIHSSCRQLLEAHADGRIEAATTVEVVQEFAHVHARRRTRADAVSLAREYATALEILVTSPADLHRGLHLFEQHPELGAFDAVLAAVALEHGAQALVSADRAFAVVLGLHWVDPAGSDLLKFVGA